MRLFLMIQSIWYINALYNRFILNMLPWRTEVCRVQVSRFLFIPVNHDTFCMKSAVPVTRVRLHRLYIMIYHDLQLITTNCVCAW